MRIRDELLVRKEQLGERTMEDFEVRHALASSQW